ncbi:conserved hypothetical protein [Enterococcus faecium 1,141,733]|nr:conserved hypothetical protein [Enterococcus faecium 1,141,733]
MPRLFNYSAPQKKSHYQTPLLFLIESMNTIIRYNIYCGQNLSLIKWMRIRLER